MNIAYFYRSGLNIQQIKEADIMNRYGYIRVSAKDQNPRRQMLALQKYGIFPKNIYLECQEKILRDLNIKN